MIRACKYGPAPLVNQFGHHAKEEENTYFPAASRVLGKGEAERLEQAYLNAKKTATS
jgi:hypothetical protein